MNTENIKIDFLADHLNFVDEITSVWQKEWIIDKSEKGFDRLKARILNKLNKDKIPFILVAIDVEDWIGTASLWEHDLDKRPDLTPWIAGVYVTEEYRGKGIATQLISKVLEIAKKLNYKTIYLHTEKAMGLYEKLGWAKLEESINDQGEPTTVYFLDLA